jgi:myo-inositol-1-phosphate synthase
MGKVKVAIIGVGNCASALIQGVQYYQNASDTDFVPGLMHVNLGGYHIRDIEFVAAFDIDSRKVGKDLSEAMFCEPNNTIKFSDVPHLGVPVHRGMTHDGLGKYLSEVITKAPGPTADVKSILRQTGADVVINYLPVGSEMATKWYVEQVLEAGCGFVNVPWLTDRKWAYIRCEGRTFGDVPLNLELKLEVWDSPNSAGVVIDALRCVKLALDRGIAGTLGGPSSYFMKSPPVQYADDQAHDMVEEFITGAATPAAFPAGV